MIVAVIALGSRSIGAGLILAVAVQFLGHRRPHEVEDLANPFLEFARLGGQRAIDFQFDMNAGATGAVILLADFPAEPDVQLERHEEFSLSWVE